MELETSYFFNYIIRATSNVRPLIGPLIFEKYRRSSKTSEMGSLVSDPPEVKVSHSRHQDLIQTSAPTNRPQQLPKQRPSTAD